MTASLAIVAPEISKKELKARRKAEKKRRNKQLEALGQALDNVREVIYGAQHRVAEARKAANAVDVSAPTQALLDYLGSLETLLNQGVALCEDQSEPAQEAIAEHFFPGRAAKWAAQDQERNDSYRYAQQERGFGA